MMGTEDCHFHLRTLPSPPLTSESDGQFQPYVKDAKSLKGLICYCFHEN